MLCQQIAWDSRLSVGGGGLGGAAVSGAHQTDRHNAFVVCSHMLDSHSRTANIIEAQTRRRGCLAVSLTNNMSTKGWETYWETFSACQRDIDSVCSQS